MSSTALSPISSDTILARLAEPVAAQLAATEQLLAGLVSERDGGVVPSVYHQALQAGGKRLRPLLTLLSCQASGGDASSCTQLAMAVEVLHLSSLIHDDVIDEASERRGRPSVRQTWGNRASILVGDFLVAQAFIHLADLPETDALPVLARAVGQMCQSELEPPPADPLQMTEERYLSNVQGKTAALMAAACEIGANAACGDAPAPGARLCLSRYGLNLGLAFQIVDDLLDLYGDEKTLGKPVLQDLQRGQWTLPVIHALRHADAVEPLHGLLLKAPGSPEAARAAATLAAKSGGRAYAEGRARELAAAACQQLLSLPATPARSSLTELAHYVVSRQY